MARTVHWVHTIACISLFITGVLIYVPSIANSLGVDALQVSRMIHRVAAALFIAIPLIAVVLKPSAFGHKLKEYFAPWTAEDKEFMKKFLPYLFAPKKIHMPKQDRYKSGQKVADMAVILFSILIAVSGAFMWGAKFFAPELVRWMYVLHDGSMIMLGVLLIAHVYVGAGIFQPYRGSARLMFGDGKIAVTDAKYHWGFWAEQELKDGTNVSEG